MQFDEKTKAAIIQALKELDVSEEEEATTTRRRKSEGVPLTALQDANRAARHLPLETKSRIAAYTSLVINPEKRAKQELFRGMQIYEQCGLDVGALVNGTWVYRD